MISQRHRRRMAAALLSLAGILLAATSAIVLAAKPAPPPPPPSPITFDLKYIDGLVGQPLGINDHGDIAVHPDKLFIAGEAPGEGTVWLADQLLDDPDNLWTITRVS